MNRKLLLPIVFVLFFSCKQQINKEVVIYNNDFETNSVSNITNGFVSQFNGSAVLGQYNRGYFTLSLNNLPSHDLITISFDLYIHDTWDGNKTEDDGPDIWQMMVDNKPYINSTFSNMACIAGNFCSPQSYPFNYPNSYNNPKTGAYRTDLPGICGSPGPNGTTQYKITKTFTHTNTTLILQCLDKLIQYNTSNQKCDESWSVDNINIKAITL
jgi:hypothetical protein